MKNRHAFVLSLCLALASLPLKGGVVPSAPEVIRGTESLSIRSIAQDAKKQIWFGTDKNLYCYDGYAPVLCLDRDGNNDHFQVNDLFCMDDKVLLGCVNGLVIYDCLQGTFRSLAPLLGIEVFDLYGDGETVWVGSRAGLLRYDTVTGELSEVDLDAVLNIRSICIDGDNLVLGTFLPAEVRIYDKDGFRLKAAFSGDDFGEPVGSIDAVAACDRDRFLVGSSRALFEIGLQDRSVRMVSPFAWVKTLCEDHGRYLVGTDNGMYSCWPDRPEDTVMSLDNVVWRIIHDAEGNLWFGSDTGLLLYRENRLIQTLDVTSAATNNLYSSICSDAQGHVFAGGSYGLLLFDEQQEGGDSPVWYRMRDPQHPFSHNKIRRIKENPYTGEVWFETAAGIVKYSGQDKAFVPVSDMRRSNAFDLLFEPDRYWIASFSGLACIMNDRIVDEVSMADGLSNNLVLQAAKDTLGRIWIRTEDQNVFLYNPQSLSLEPFRMDGRASDTGWDYLLEDSDGNIWLADRNRIYKIEPAKSRTSPVRSYDLHGRQTSEVSALVEVENSVWAAYANNLFILDKESSGIHAITADVAYSGMFYDKRSGRVYLGALDRIDVIDHREAIDRIGQQGLGLYITRISVNNVETVPPSKYAG
ncbi:MAG: two-component regulator propeller domain-containing protein, partial [Eubacteriales bacterium]